MTIFFMIFFLRAFRRNSRLRRRLFRTSAVAPFLRLRYGTPAAVLHSLTHFIKKNFSLPRKNANRNKNSKIFQNHSVCVQTEALPGFRFFLEHFLTFRGGYSFRSRLQSHEVFRF